MVRETLIETAREQNIPVLDGHTLEETLKMLDDSGRAYDVMYVTLQKLDLSERLTLTEKDFPKRPEQPNQPVEFEGIYGKFSVNINLDGLVKIREAQRVLKESFDRLIEETNVSEEPHKNSSYLDKLGGSLVGQKVEGIRFSEDNKYVNWVYDMEKYIGQKGTIIEEHDHSVVVFFDDISFWYPKEEILKSFY